VCYFDMVEVPSSNLGSPTKTLSFLKPITYNTFEFQKT